MYFFFFLMGLSHVGKIISSFHLSKQRQNWNPVKYMPTKLDYSPTNSPMYSTQTNYISKAKPPFTTIKDKIL